MGKEYFEDASRHGILNGLKQVVRRNVRERFNFGTEYKEAKVLA